MTFEQVRNVGLASDVGRSNLLTNGGFEIWQRGGGPFTSTSTYTADRWFMVLSGSDTLNVQRSPTADVTSQFSAVCVFTKGSGTNTGLYQQIEYQQIFVGRTVTLSVRVYTATANAVRPWIYDGFSGGRTYGSYHTGGSTWQTLTVSASVTTPSQMVQAGVEFNVSTTAYIDNAMLVVGSQPADYVPMHPADDLARCLRYYEVGALKPINIYGSAGQSMGMPVWYRAWKAVAPTVTKVSAWGVSNGSGAAAGYNHQDGFDVQWTCTATGTTSCGPAAAIDWTAEANP